jgi:hypothetical protein
LKQLQNIKVLEPVKKSTVTRQELLGVLNTIAFIKTKRCGRIKARTCADGRPQRKLYKIGNASSPTVRTESVVKNFGC